MYIVLVMHIHKIRITFYQKISGRHLPHYHSKILFTDAAAMFVEMFEHLGRMYIHMRSKGRCWYPCVI